MKYIQPSAVSHHAEVDVLLVTPHVGAERAAKMKTGLQRQCLDGTINEPQEFDKASPVTCIIFGRMHLP